jgi:signal peptidase I
MSTSELFPELDIPLTWIQPRAIKRDAKALVTVTGEFGEQSVLISYRGIKDVDSDDYVAAPKALRGVKPKSIREKLTFFPHVIGWSLIALIFSFAILNLAGIMQARVVLSGSMAPAINPGDVVFTVSANHLHPTIGDVVTYTGKRFDGTKVADFTHRIISGDAKNGFTVKGDHNPLPDVQKPNLSDLDGVVLFTVPKLGKVLTPQVLILLLIAGFGVWLIADAFRSEE